MRRAPSVTLLAFLGCAAALREETVAVPGTHLRLELVPVDGPRPFWISRREVTWAEFDRFCEFPEDETSDGITRPSSGKSYLQLSGLPPELMRPDLPVTNLRYHSALAYCEWLSRRTGQIFRLPTEREWEIAESSPGMKDMHGSVWEYCLESDRPPDFEPVLRGGAWNAPADLRRTTAPAEWSLADPNRPFSLWWFREGHSQGFRVVRVAEAAGPREREAYARKIEISGLAGRDRVARVGSSVVLLCRVTGEIRNGGDRALDEIALKVYYLDPAGNPHLEDTTANLTRRPTWNLCMPALVASAHPGGHARPLLPGERRRFEVDLPRSLDPEASVRSDAFGASVLHLQFSPPLPLARQDAPRVLEGHGGSVMSLAFSPDGKTLASSSRDDTVRLWDVAMGRFRRALAGHGDDVYAVVYSPDGRTLATASGDRTIRLWDAESGEVRRTIEGHGDIVRAVVFSPDGRRLASAGKDRTVRLWDPETGKELRRFDGHAALVKSIGFSPDGRLLASAGGEPGVRTWDVATGASAVLEGKPRGYETIAWSPDGKRLATSSSEGPVLVWDAEGRKLLETLPGHELEADSVAWAPDGRLLASGSKDRTVRLWDAKTWTLRRSFVGSPGRIESLAFSPDGRTLASGGGGGDTAVKLWVVGP